LLPVEVINKHVYHASLKRILLIGKKIVLTYINGDTETYYAIKSATHDAIPRNNAPRWSRR